MAGLDIVYSMSLARHIARHEFFQRKTLTVKSDEG